MTMKPAAQPKAAPSKKKGPTRWRDLTDEERWKRIYADREKRAEEVIQSLQEAVALALPAYAMHMAITEMHQTNSGMVRYDAHQAVVGAIALVASRLKPVDRDQFATKLEQVFGTLRRVGFFTDAREFLYAVSYAVVRLADTYHYPSDSPATMAALLFKEDAEDDDAGNSWGLSKAHAAKCGILMYETFRATGFYRSAI
jgi:hypothetical protein